MFGLQNRYERIHLWVGGMALPSGLSVGVVTQTKTLCVLNYCVSNCSVLQNKQ